jgi:ribosome maturation factor RimP
MGTGMGTGIGIGIGIGIGLTGTTGRSRSRKACRACSEARPISAFFAGEHPGLVCLNRRSVVKIPFPKGTPRTSGRATEPAFFLSGIPTRRRSQKDRPTPKMRKEISELWKLIEPYTAGAGFDLVELQWGRDGGGWALRIFIDRPFTPGDGPRLPGASEPDPLFGRPAVGHEDCERVSRDVSAALDVADIIPHEYVLEVSSPGLDRPLRREQDFRRFAGQQVKIRTSEPVEGRKNFAGTLVGAQAGVAEVSADGRSYRVPIDLVAKANLVPDWAAEFRRSQQAEQEIHAGRGGTGGGGGEPGVGRPRGSNSRPQGAHHE